MYKKTITYEDFNGLSRTEDFYFNLTQRELAKLEVITDGGYAGMLTRIANAKDIEAIDSTMETLINMSYGVKDNDGRNFIKNEKVLADFVSTQAYSDFYWELTHNEDEALKFVNGIMPKEMAKDKNSGPLVPAA